MSRHRTHSQIAADDERILALRREGLPCREIAEQLGLREHEVWGCAHRHGVAMQRPGRVAAPDSPGGQIRAARLAACMSRGKLAELAGVAETTLQKIERGVEAGGERTLRRLRAALHLPEPDGWCARGAFSVTEHDGVVRVLLTSTSQLKPVLKALQALGGVVL